MDVALNQLRNERYTGSNRCWKCTVLNIFLISVIMSALAILSPVAAVVGWVVGIGIIAVRGYFLPFTPTIAPAFFGLFPGIDSFTHPGDSSTEANVNVEDEPYSTGTNILEELLQKDIIKAEEGELCLDEGFREHWHSQLNRVAASDELATTAETTFPQSITVSWMNESERDSMFVTNSESKEYGEVVSRFVMIADIATVKALRELAPELDSDTRLQAAQSLRMFLETCVKCGSDLERDVRSAGCCGGGPYKEFLVCSECDEELFAFGPA